MGSPFATYYINLSNQPIGLFFYGFLNKYFSSHVEEQQGQGQGQWPYETDVQSIKSSSIPIIIISGVYYV